MTRSSSGPCLLSAFSRDSCSHLVCPSTREMLAARIAELPKEAHVISSKKELYLRGMRNNPILGDTGHFPLKHAARLGDSNRLSSETWILPSWSRVSSQAGVFAFEGSWRHPRKREWRVTDRTVLKIHDESLLHFWGQTLPLNQFQK